MLRVQVDLHNGQEGDSLGRLIQAQAARIIHPAIIAAHTLDLGDEAAVQALQIVATFLQCLGQSLAAGVGHGNGLDEYLSGRGGSQDKAAVGGSSGGEAHRWNQLP